MSDKPKRHHYVPSVYLKGFADNDGYITTVEKPSGRHFRTAPHNTALIKHHNTVRFSDGSHDSETMEGFFSKIESDFANAMNEINDRVASTQAIQAVILFAATQRMRTPLARKTITRIFEVLGPEFREIEGFHKLSEEELLLWNAAQGGDSTAAEQIALRTSGHAMLATAAQFERMGFLVVETSGNPRLIASDNSVAVFAPSGRSKKVGMPVPDGRRTHCIFPLTHNRFLFGDNNLLDEYALYGLRYVDLSEQRNIVSKICRATAISAEKYIFSDRFPRREIGSYEVKSTNRRNKSFSNLQLEYSKLLKQVARIVLSGQKMSGSNASSA